MVQILPLMILLLEVRVHNSFNFVLFLNFFYYFMAPVLSWLCYLSLAHGHCVPEGYNMLTLLRVLSYSCPLFLGIPVSYIQYKPGNVMFDSSIISRFPTEGGCQQIKTPKYIHGTPSTGF